MAQRTATITQFQFYKKNARKADKYLDMAVLPDNGDFLSFVAGVWNGLKPNTLHNRSKQRYCDPYDRIAEGRTLTLSAMAGVYGDPGSVRDVTSGEERLSHDGDLTNAIPLRVALFVPRRGTSSLLFVEHVTGVAFGSQFIDHLKLCWDQRYPDWTLKPQTLTRPDAWLQSARLSAVHAEVYDHHVTLDRAGRPTSMGMLSATLIPKKGAQYFPAEVLQKLQAGTIARADLLGLPVEPDNVKITLGDGEQQKTFVLGMDRTPPVRQLVTDYGEPALSDDKFRAWCGSEVGTHMKAVGADWDASMMNGDWSAEDLAMTIEFDDGR